MKKLFVCGLLMAVVLTACQNKGIEVLTQSRSKAFTAIVEESFTDDTKTSMDGDGNVLWKKGDQVSLFAGSTVNEQYQVSDDSDGKTSASLNKVTGGGFVAGTDIDNNVAFYPYASAAGITKSESNYIISDITLPATQSYAAGSFGNGAFPMVAVTGSTEDMTLKFKNVLGGLKLQLKGTATITSISVSGNNNEILCGASEVTTTYGGVPSVSLSDASARTVTLDCGAGVALNTETATPFIIALPPMTMEGGFTVVVTDSDGQQMEIKTTRTQPIPRSNLLRMPAVTYEGTSPEVVVPEMVDLGLSVKWASFNLGAASPEEYGDYYSWGETEVKSIYEWSTYKYGDASNNALTKYCYDSRYGYNGYTDGRTVLDMSDDVARLKLGESWRMATKAEWTELQNQCTWSWTKQNGVNGYKVTSKTNGNSIFLPAAGRRIGTSPNDVGSYLYYWSSSLSSYITFDAWTALSVYSGVYWYSLSRYYGESIRPVYDSAIHVTAISLDHSDLTFTELSTVQTLTAEVTPSDATNKNVTWSSSNTAVATVAQDGKVTSVGYGTATITATTEDSGLTATCEVRVITLPEGPVDLGLSVKWASCNVGASSPEEYGDYFAWGETEAKSIYDWSTYKWCAGSNSSITKYCNNANYGNEGFTDNKIVLDVEDDVARVKLGGKWRIPIDAEFVELWNTEGNPNYKWEWKTINNHNGWHITYLVNGNSIFLPAAGWRDGNYSYYTGNHGDYMASQLSTTNSDVAWGMNFDSGVITYGHYSRSSGRSVRPVYDESIIPLDTNVEFEDTKFKAYCLANFDKDGDGEVSHKEALDVEAIDIYCGNMNSLKGIEWFINLKRLICGWNNLTSLDVSHNTALIYLGCEQNKLSSLDVSHNTALQKLECYSNQLTNLDVSKNLLLTHFTCGWNQLTSIDVSHNTALTIFGCDANPLKVLDVSHNTALTTLGCYRNELKNLDISHNAELQELVCFANELTNLDISHNTKLIKIECNGNCLASIDVSKNIALTQLDCRTNQLTSLDISNNAALTDLWCSSNPSLSVLWMKRNQNISTLDYDSSITNIKYVDDFSQSAAVDLGLSVKWGSCNIGATTPEEYGNYYAWGETAPKSKYNWSKYKYCNGNYNTLTKYCSKSTYGLLGYTDSKAVLDQKDDVAHVELGGNWRMPTDAEWTELLEQCTWSWTTRNEINGYLVTSKANGNSIFLPAAGAMNHTGLHDDGSFGDYWSSSLYAENPDHALGIYFGSSVSLESIDIRYYGQSIRPVSDESIIMVSSIELSPTEGELKKWQHIQLSATVYPANASQRGVKWSSSNESVAAVDESGLVTAYCEGTATISATSIDGGFTATCSLTVLPSESVPAPKVVDLGLSVKWASFNIGASSPEEYGDYYAWGEITVKSNYDWATYKYCNGSNITLTKYCSNSSNGYNGYTDSKTVLDMSDDVARVKLGGRWRIPTDAEWTELREKCTWTWTTKNGVYGYRVTGIINGNSIFLPIAGYRGGTSLYDVHNFGNYWSSSLYSLDPDCARCVSLYFDGVYGGSGNRSIGLSVRPVTE